MSARMVLCHPCATALVNDDTSGLSDDDAMFLARFAEVNGILVPVGPAGEIGWFDCPGCGQRSCDDGEIMESIA